MICSSNMNSFRIVLKQVHCCWSVIGVVGVYRIDLKNDYLEQTHANYCYKISEKSISVLVTNKTANHLKPSETN